MTRKQESELLEDFRRYRDSYQKRYMVEIETGDSVSIASTRSSWLASRDMIDILQEKIRLSKKPKAKKP